MGARVGERGMCLCGRRWVPGWVRGSRQGRCVSSTVLAYDVIRYSLAVTFAHLLRLLRCPGSSCATRSWEREPGFFGKGVFLAEGRSVTAPAGRVSELAVCVSTAAFGSPDKAWPSSAGSFPLNACTLRCNTSSGALGVPARSERVGRNAELCPHRCIHWRPDMVSRRGGSPQA